MGYLRFDEENEFHAPDEPKLFLDYCHNKDRENLFETIRSDLESKWQFYAETKIAEMKKSMEVENEAKLRKTKLELQERLEKDFSKRLFEKDLNLKDCRDREEKDITPFKDFGLIYDQFWTIKGVVLSGLAVAGMEYYISNTYDENDMTASINNNAFKIRFEAVERVMQPRLLKRVKI